MKSLLAAAAALLAFALPAAAQQQGVTGDTVTIGAHGPITGPAAYIGLAGRDTKRHLLSPTADPHRWK